MIEAVSRSECILILDNVREVLISLKSPFELTHKVAVAALQVSVYFFHFFNVCGLSVLFGGREGHDLFV